MKKAVKFIIGGGSVAFLGWLIWALSKMALTGALILLGAETVEGKEEGDAKIKRYGEVGVATLLGKNKEE